MNQQKHNQMPGLRRGFRLVGLLAKCSEGCTFGELGAATELPPPTLSRILKVLCEEEYVVKRNGNYALGPAFYTLARRTLGQVDWDETLAAGLERLRQVTRQSAAFFEFAPPDQMLMRAKREATDSFHYMALGAANINLGRNGFGQVITAFAGNKLVARLFETELRPVVARPDFEQRLQRIRETGWFIERGESQPYVVRVAAPVTYDATIVGAVGISMAGDPTVPEHDEQIQSVLNHVLTTASEFSQFLKQQQQQQRSIP